MIDRKQLIEDAAKAISEESWHLRGDFAHRYAEISFAVFEGAYAKDLATSPEHAKNPADSSHVTPTDDEREALSEFLFTVYDHGSQPNALREADAILAFLRSRRTVQGEPSDAQVNAAVDTYIDARLRHDSHEAAMRAALRAAASVEGTDQ